MRRLSFRTLLYWLAPTAGVGALTGQTRAPVESGRIAADTLAGLKSRYLADVPMVRVYLPPDYRESRERYPVLYTNDGQDAEAMRLVPLLDSLISGEMIPPIIVVAVHAGPDRLQNYGTAGQLNAQGLGNRAQSYERFFLRELLPLIAERYRIQQKPQAIMGWSLGGLSAFDLAWRNSEEFAAVGVFSGSFWWRTDDSTVASRQASRIMHRRVRETARAPRLRIWLEAGRADERDDRDGNGVIDAIQDTRELIDEMVRKGMREGTDLHYLEMDGGHNPATWSRALPGFLTWAFGPGTR